MLFICDILNATSLNSVLISIVGDEKLIVDGCSTCSLKSFIELPFMTKSVDSVVENRSELMLLSWAI